MFCRWHNHLNPDIKKDAWTLEEELALMNAHWIYGNKWAEIAKVLPGRYNSFLVYNTRYIVQVLKLTPAKLTKELLINYFEMPFESL